MAAAGVVFAPARLRSCGRRCMGARDLAGPALAAVVQLAGRWLRKRNIHFQDLMFLQDAIWVLDLIYLLLEGLHFVTLKFSHFSGKTFLLYFTSVLTSNCFLIFLRFSEKL